jgi:hypothetical protein
MKQSITEGKSHKQRRGIEENWFIDSIDTETRFMASDYFSSRGQKEIKQEWLGLILSM